LGLIVGVEIIEIMKIMKIIEIIKITEIAKIMKIMKPWMEYKNICKDPLGISLRQ
jgi:hypothetical protein